MRVCEAGIVITRVIPRPLALAAIALATLPVPARAQQAATSREASSADSSFREFLPTFEAAIRSFLDGDDAAWKELLSDEPRATLFTPLGDVVRGDPALREWYDRAAARFAPGPARLEVEYLSVEVSGDLAYVAALERSTFRFAGHDSTRTGFTRATMVFRREAGGWKLRHRHTDHLGAPPGRSAERPGGG